MHTQRDLSAADAFNIEPRPRPALCIYMKMVYNNLRPLSSALYLQPSGPGEESCLSDGVGGTGDHIRWAPMFMEPNAVKRGRKREGRGCLPGSH